jgi:hypothetical protein
MLSVHNILLQYEHDFVGLVVRQYHVHLMFLVIFRVSCGIVN